MQFAEICLLNTCMPQLTLSRPVLRYTFAKGADFQTVKMLLLLRQPFPNIVYLKS